MQILRSRQGVFVTRMPCGHDSIHAGTVGRGRKAFALARVNASVVILQWSFWKKCKVRRKVLLDAAYPL